MQIIMLINANYYANFRILVIANPSESEGVAISLKNWDCRVACSPDFSKIFDFEKNRGSSIQFAELNRDSQ